MRSEAALVFTLPVGYVRAMALIVTDQPQFQSGIQSLPDFSSGGAVLPDEIGKQLLMDKHVFALIYSWKREWGQAPTMVSRELSALTHLQKSGFIDGLRQARN